MRYVAILLGTIGISAFGGVSGLRGDVSEECRQARAWAAAAFGWEQQTGRPVPDGLQVRRQDHARLMRRKSVLDTPLQLGEKRYERGLGTHATSEIVVRLPEPGGRLTADVGVDNNHDTAAKHGSVVFAVEIAGKTVFRSKLLRGGEPPLPVDVDLGGARQFVLRVFDGGDGTGWDQADWADAAVVYAGGKQIWLDDMPITSPGEGPSTATPFSFVYGDKSSSELLPAWRHTVAEEKAANGRQQRTSTFVDPETGLEVVCETTLFDGFPAVEWVVHLRNTGKTDTPILKDILPLDLRIHRPQQEGVTLHHAQGSRCEASDFMPIDAPVPPKTAIELTPNGGRSSDGRLPFFNLAWEDGGVVGAIGWSGQWAVKLQRDTQGGLGLQAGQQTTHLKLRPGETIRTPRTLLVFWQGQDRLRGHNLLRRLLIEHYLPRIDGRLVVPPVTQNTWFVFNSGNGVNEANQLEAIRRMAPLGVEAYWLDAGWFEGGWPTGVGSWVPRAEAFPRGLKPLGDAAHEKGMKFIVWFEPERVHPKSRIAKEHPEFVLRHGNGDGLFNLGDPAARAWLTDHLSGCIKEGGIDVYRNDFNIDPLRFWRAADAPDRQGMTEIRYIEGLYAMWDELRERHPGLWIDTCASGGRRIDLEILTRSLPLWRSDTQCCGRAMPVQDQAQIAGLSLYVPLHNGGCWSFDPFAFRSVATTGTNICLDGGSKDFPVELAKAAVEEAKSLRPLYLGDYYPLVAVNLDDGQWCAWQFDRPELGRGFALFFRREKSPYVSVEARLRGLQADAAYQVTFREQYEVARECQMTGAELARLRPNIDSAPGSLLVVYRKITERTR